MVLVAEAYFDGLSKKFSAVAQQVPSLTKLRRRLILSGEDGLRDVFACGMARHSGSPAEIRFKEDDVMSEFAMVELKLEEALEALRKAAPVNQDQETKSADAAGASVGGSSDTQKQQQAEVSKSDGHGAQGNTTDPQLAEAADQEDWAEARARMDDVLLVMETPRVTQGALTMPAEMNPLPAGTMFVIPAPARTRGKPSKAVNFKSVRKYFPLTWMTDVHCLLICLGHDPSSLGRFKEKLEGAYPVIGRCAWIPTYGTVPVLQHPKKMESGAGYVEHLAVAVGKGCPPISLPGWISGVLAYPKEDVRIVANCSHDPCPTSTSIAKRFLVPFPEQQEPKKAPSQSVVSALLGCSDDDGEEVPKKEVADSAESSEDSSGDEEVAQHHPDSTQKGGGWTRNFRQGMAPETWLRIFGYILPPKVILTGGLHCQPGLIMAVLLYNDGRVGLSQCPCVVFHPREHKGNDAPAQAAHLAAHVLDRITQAYHNSQMDLSKKKPARGIRRNAGDSAAKGGPSGSSAGGPAEVVKVEKLITINGNSKWNATSKDEEVLFPVQGMEENDSDTEACGGDCACLDSNVLSKRNTATMEKHGLKVKMSPAACAPGYGVFATKALENGIEIPIKGPVFDSIAELESWLAKQNPATARSMALKVVQLNFSVDNCPQAKYKVMTQLLGFINDFRGIAPRPNAILQWKADRPMDQHSLVCKLTSCVDVDKEILINYGPKHPTGSQVCKARKRKLGADGAGGMKKAKAAQFLGVFNQPVGSGQAFSQATPTP